MTRPERVQKRKRFILIDREHGNVLGDTGYDWNGQPVPLIPASLRSGPQRCCKVAAQPITIPTAIARSDAAIRTRCLMPTAHRRVSHAPPKARRPTQ